MSSEEVQKEHQEDKIEENKVAQKAEKLLNIAKKEIITADKSI
jgi:translation initiation factor 2 alpha subunit (eIF-2alpha)